jgi:glycosyltransferase involved in cell wall biosynthesis
MKISVVTPCYNAEKYIEETIISVLGQRGDFEIEYIIMDGGSTDNTLSILRNYKGWTESGSLPIRCNKVTFMYISQKDEGMYDALAKGFRLVTGDVVAYVNSDDFYLPNAFSTVTEIFGGHPEVQWLTGMITGYNERGQIIDCLLPFRFDRAFIQKGICGTILPFIQQESTFWKRKLADNLDLDLLKKHKFAGDFYMWYTFSKNTDLYIIYSCLGGFRSRPEQLSKQRSKYLKEFLIIGEKKSFIDVVVAYLFKGVTYFVPNIIKRALGKNMIYFDGKQWIKKGEN